MRWLVLAVAALVACDEPRLAWRATFATETLSVRAARVRYAIERGPCAAPPDARDVVWSAEVDLAEAVEAPGALGSGTFAFRVEARDDRCVRFAEGCRELTLPRSGASVEVLVGHVAPSPVCEAPLTCIDGACRTDVAVPSWPCLEGWLRVPLEDESLSGISVCEPFAPRLDCEEEWTWQLPGERTCTRPGGDACEQVDGDGWPLAEPERAVYVLPGEGDEDGGASRADPRRNLRGALRDAAPGTTVVALGTFVIDAELHVPREVTLLGSCTRTRLLLAEPTGPEGNATLTLDGGALRNLQVLGGAPGIRVRGPAVIEGVVVDGAHGLGVLVEPGSHLRSDQGFVVRGTRLSDVVVSEQGRGRGVSVRGGAATLNRLVLDGNAGDSFLVGLFSRVELTRSVVLRNATWQAVAISNGYAVLRGIVVEGGLVNCDGAASCVVEDTVVRAGPGRELALTSDQGDLTVERAWLDGSVSVRDVNQELSGLGMYSNAILRDVVVVAPPTAAHAVEAVESGDLVLDRFVVSGGARCAISLQATLRPSVTRGVLLHSPAGVCSDSATELDRCGVTALDVARDRRVSGPPIEACDGCDSDGDGVADDAAGEALCPEVDPSYDIGDAACLVVSPGEPSPSPRHRCCVPRPPTGCTPDSRYERELIPLDADQRALAPACCTR